MPISDTIVQQDAFSAYKDGTGGMVHLNRRGDIVTPDFYQQLVMDGRVFQINNAAFETAEALSTAFGTNGESPSIYVGVPSGTTIMPLEIRLTQGGTVGADAWTCLVAYENSIPASVSVTARVPINMRTDRPHASTCTCGVTGTVTAPGDDALIHGGIYTQMVADPVHPSQDVLWSARDSLAPVIVGGGCLLIYAFVATTGPSLFYRVVWAEFPTVNAT